MKGKIIPILVITLLITTAISAVGTMNAESNNDLKPCSASTIVWSDDFDSYTAGNPLHGQGGWEAWDLDTKLSSYVSDEQSHSTSNSMELNWWDDQTWTDIVHIFYGVNSGVWSLKTWQYIPQDTEGYTYLILFHTYKHGGSHSQGDTIGGLVSYPHNGVISDINTGTEIPLITDQWIEIKIQIDFNQQTVTTYYNETMVDSIIWSGPKNLACIDICNDVEWSTSSYFDDFTLEGDVSENTDLYCEGELQFTDIVPGDTVSGSFLVQNIGAPSTMLDWEIAETPEWGEWSFEPNSGTDLEGWNPITVDVEITAPDTKDTFTGELKIVNSENPDDFEIIEITLTTPRGKLKTNTIIQRLFERFPNMFPIIRQLLI